uniref:HMG box domain-containing protein n=1 Tax=Arion vulgaris TaxID=1028688 RepID=A0A0B7BJ32_9EUPU
MSKRELDFDPEGSFSKMRKDEQDDAGGSARSGRVRKKSAKVLEMEEFEQVEKTQYVTKKGKVPKAGGKIPSEEQETVPSTDKAPFLVKKIKIAKSPVTNSVSMTMDITPVTSKVGSIGTGKSELSSHAAKQVHQFLPMQLSSDLSQADLLATTFKSDYQADLPMMSELGVHQQIMQHSPVKSDDQKSVIKYLLSSPSSSSKPSVSTNVLNKMGSSPISNVDTHAVSKKLAKKPPKPQDPNAVKKSKPKKLKIESLSPTLANDILGVDKIGTSLKMKILSSSDPATAQVTLNTQSEHTAPAKHKKNKKVKEIETEHDLLMDSVDILGFSKLETEDLTDTPVKKPKKVSKKKEKLIQDAISAAQQMPNLAALVASQTSHIQGQQVIQATVSTPEQKSLKTPKKKLKTISPVSMSASNSDDPNESLGRSDLSFGDDGEETHLVIAETEKKKKKPFSKKKVLTHKDKSGSASPKRDNMDKQLSKRAPTAYMLFCNTHRPTIVNENPGIEFAGISRKLGEMWQTLSNKQKLQWRRKAQRRRKKGSNLISTGKASREPGAAALISTSSVQSNLSPRLKLSTLMQKAHRSSPEDTPQSPTKNFSIEPIDVAAHLKLLGESLSIIGMRLQEHKGMIAVQGSLSVLLDSLLCACGPLLCLTQQVPSMDGCSPLVHGQTLDSVAYVMPGL